ncbi:hypothetical protein D3C81_1483820 [compost metagenome]
MDHADACTQFLPGTRTQGPGLGVEQFDVTDARLQAGRQHPQQGGFAGARRADDGHPFAGFDPQIDMFERLDAIGMRQAHAGQLQYHFNSSAERAASSMLT